MVEPIACDTGFSAASAALTPGDEKDVPRDATRAGAARWGAA